MIFVNKHIKIITEIIKLNGESVGDYCKLLSRLRKNM